MTKIFSITEAFSESPITLTITSQEKYDGFVTDEMRRNAVKEIRHEIIQTGSNIFNDYYVGYGFCGERLFEYLRSSVNVHYCKHEIN